MVSKADMDQILKDDNIEYWKDYPEGGPPPPEIQEQLTRLLNNMFPRKPEPKARKGAKPTLWPDASITIDFGKGIRDNGPVMV